MPYKPKYYLKTQSFDEFSIPIIAETAAVHRFGELTELEEVDVYG